MSPFGVFVLSLKYCFIISSKALVLFPMAEITTSVFSKPTDLRTFKMFLTPAVSLTDAPPNLNTFIA